MSDSELQRRLFAGIPEQLQALADTWTPQVKALASGEWQLCPDCGDPVTGACRPGACANPNHCAVCGQPSGDLQVCDRCTIAEEARMKRSDDI